MKSSLIYVAATLFSALTSPIGAQETDFPILTGAYLGQEPPRLTPTIFAPRIISTKEGMHSSPAFSPDGSRVCWTSMTSGIMFMEVANNRWTPPAPVPFQKGAFRKCDSPCWSADGSKLYFISLLLAGDSGIETLCYVETMENAWSEPALFDSVINSGNLHWQFSFADNGNLYFSSERENGFGGYDLYRSDCTNGVYSEPENLGPTVNTAESDATPFIAHDESCLIFASTGRDDGLGRSDLYVSFLMEDSTWTEPRNLGPRINTVHHEICPVVTPDGKYLFFLRSQSVYWIDASVIGELKPEN